MDYEDIINTKTPLILKHPRMEKDKRASQFDPFWSLPIYKDEINLENLEFDRKIDLAEDEIKKINDKLNEIKSNIKSHPLVEVTYFSYYKDLNGFYLTKTSHVKKIDEINQILYLKDLEIPFDMILEISDLPF